MSYSQADLEMAVRHVRDGRTRIAELEAGIAHGHGNDKRQALATEALKTMRRTLELMVEHEHAIRASVTAGQGPPNPN